MNRQDEWLSKLKVGDVVAVETGYAVLNWRIEKVVGLTKLHVLVGRLKTKYRLRGGGRAGNHGTYSDYIVEATPELRAKMKLQNDRAVIRSLNVNDLSDEQVSAVAAAVRAALKTGT